MFSKSTISWLDRNEFGYGKMTCAENPPPSILKQDGLCTKGLYCTVIAVINHEKLSRARECVRTAAHRGLVRARRMAAK